MNGGVDAVIGAEAQRVVFLGQIEVRARGLVAAEREFAARELEKNIWMMILGIRQPFRFRNCRPRFAMLPLAQQRHTFGEHLIPPSFVGFIEPRTVNRRKGRAVAQVDRDRAKQNPRAGVVTKMRNVFEVVAEAGINVRHARIAAANALLEKHLHAAPLNWPALAQRR